MRGDPGDRNLLAPARRDSRWAAARDLDDETSTVTIELHCQEINTRWQDATEVRERSREAVLAKRGNERLFQGCVHGVPAHDSSTIPRFGGRRFGGKAVISRWSDCAGSATRLGPALSGFRYAGSPCSDN